MKVTVYNYHKKTIMCKDQCYFLYFIKKAITLKHKFEKKEYFFLSEKSTLKHHTDESDFKYNYLLI